MKEKSTILIVDDSELNRTVLADILGDEYNFIEAENGARAIELLRTHTDIDLILLDIEMDRLNGMELAKHLSFQWGYAPDSVHYGLFRLHC